MMATTVTAGVTTAPGVAATVPITAAVAVGVEVAAIADGDGVWR